LPIKAPLPAPTLMLIWSPLVNANAGRPLVGIYQLACEELDVVAAAAEIRKPFGSAGTTLLSIGVPRKLTRSAP
jgi:hypothetical protein